MSAGQGEVIVEFVVMGESVKVTAIDALTLHEVSMVGPVSYPRALLVRQAVKKLRYVQARQGEPDGSA
jgi:hypothetical protein